MKCNEFMFSGFHFFIINTHIIMQTKIVDKTKIYVKK